MTYDSEVLADSPVFYLKLDETSGTSCADSSGNGNTFTYQTGVVLAQTGLLSDGGTSIASSGAVSPSIMSSVPASLTAGTDFTLEAWVYVTTTSQKFNIVSIGNGSNGYSLDINAGTGYGTSGNKLGAAKAGVGNVTSGAFGAIGTGAHHVAVTRSGNTAVFYIDGVNPGGTPGSWSGILAPTTQCTIGGPVDKLQASQRIDNVAVYASALSSTRIAAHYAARNAPASAPGKFHFPTPLRRQAVVRSSSY